MKIDSSMSATAYHIETGAFLFPYAIDAHSAVSRFPKEWSFTPWGKDGAPTAAVIEIPADWEEMGPQKRIALAVQMGAERKGLTAAKADEVILAEVERREAEPAPE